MQTLPRSLARWSQEFLVGIVVTLTTLFFLLDVYLPLGVAGGVPYVTVVLMTLWLHGTRVTLTMAIVCTCLTMVGFGVSPEGGGIVESLGESNACNLCHLGDALLTFQYKNSVTAHLEERSLLRRIIDLIPQFVYVQSSDGQLS